MVNIVNYIENKKVLVMKNKKRIFSDLKFLPQIISFLFKNDKKLFVLILIESVLSSISPFILLFYTRNLIDLIYKNANIIQFINVSIGYLSIFVFVEIMKLVLNALVNRKEKYALLLKMSDEFYSKPMYLKYCDLNEPHFLNHVGYAKSFINGKCNQMIALISNFEGSIITFILSLYLLVNLEVISFVVILLYVSIEYYLKTFFIKKVYKNNYLKAEFNRKIQYYDEVRCNAQYYKDIKLYGLETKIEKECNHASRSIFKLTKKNQNLLFVNTLITSFIECVLFISLYYLISNKIITITQNLSYFAVSISAISIFKNLLVSTIGSYNEINNDYEFMKYYKDFVCLNDYEEHEGLSLDSVESIEFINVSFKYPNSDALILKNVNFRITKGQKVAIIGQNGSGKTTLTNLILGFYKPTEGQILVNGIELSKYDRASYLNKVSGISQNFKLFSMSIKDNITYMPDEIHDDKYNEALKLSNLEKLISQLKYNDNTCLYKYYDKEGINLSGGEMQKVAFARAIYKKEVDLFIFDEPTSSMDAISEVNLYKNYLKIIGNGIGLFVSHRISCVSICDNVLYLENGNVIFSKLGNLLKSNIDFNELYYTYFNSYKESLNILVIDSGINCNHPKLKNKNVIFLNNSSSNENAFGHGNAILGIISNNDYNVNYYSYEVSNFQNGITEDELIFILQNIIDLNINFDIIHISAGITLLENTLALESLFNTLVNRGALIVSAFSNIGQISFPAAFKNVIGVVGDESINKTDQIVYYQSEVLNFGAFGKRQRLCWNNPEYIYLEGNSFAAAWVTRKLIDALYLGYTKTNAVEYLKEKSLKSVQVEDFSNLDKNSFFDDIHSAAILGYNKETKCILNNLDLLDFKIRFICETKYSFNISKKINEVDTYINSDLIIVNIETVDLNSIDLIIIGNLSNTIPDTYLDKLCKKIMTYRVKVYLFDEKLVSFFNDYPYLYIPMLNISKRNYLPMLNKFNKPVIMICGTSSNQGKFSLQLKLRRLFLKEGYEVGQIGTEPASDLFGFDYSVPIGYRSTSNLEGADLIKYFNNKVYQLSLSKDIIIVGTQANSASFDNGNLQQINLDFLPIVEGSDPDIAILTINYYDDINYIKRTIRFIESINQTKVVALVIFPVDIKRNYMDNFKKDYEIPFIELEKFKDYLEKEINIKSFILNDDISISKLYNLIIASLSN